MFSFPEIILQNHGYVFNYYEKNLRTEEELKIRRELEMDIERDLEEEIKGGIYHLALRLHRLYQHRKERSHKSDGETLSEVNINIRMEGGTKVEIKVITKKDQAVPQKLVRPGISSSRSSENPKSVQFMRSKKKFDWVNSLRSDSGPVIVHKKIHGSQASLVSNDHRRDRGIIISVNNDPKPLDLGWKIQD